MGARCRGRSERRRKEISNLHFLCPTFISEFKYLFKIAKRLYISAKSGFLSKERPPHTSGVTTLLEDDICTERQTFPFPSHKGKRVAAACREGQLGKTSRRSRRAVSECGLFILSPCVFPWGDVKPITEESQPPPPSIPVISQERIVSC